MPLFQGLSRCPCDILMIVKAHQFSNLDEIGKSTYGSYYLLSLDTICAGRNCDHLLCGWWHVTAAVPTGSVSSVLTAGEPPPPPPAPPRLVQTSSFQGPLQRGHTTRASVLHRPATLQLSAIVATCCLAPTAPCPILCVKKVHRSTQTCVCGNPTELWHHNRYILITKIQQLLLSCSCNTMLPLHSNDM